MKTIYVPCKSRIDPLPILEEHQDILKDSVTIGLISTIQHLHHLPGIKTHLEETGKKILVAGQVLGCDVENATKIASEVDCFLYVGSGRFHPLKIAVETDKPVYVLNTEAKELAEITGVDVEKLLKKKKGRISRAISAETFGILVSTKTCQMKADSSWKLKEKIESLGKNAFVFAGEEINPDNVLAFKVDAWVNTACPRITEDYFAKPVINPDELEYIT